MKTFPKLTLSITLALGFASATQAATNLWQTTLTFNEFEQLPGGFDDDTLPILLQNRTSGGSVTKNYDVLKPQGSGQVEGQDGVTDLTMKTHVVDGTGARWLKAEAVKRRNTYMGNVIMDSGTSKSGDFAVVAYEFTVSSHVDVSASDFGVRVASANGLGEIYEWTFVTTGGFEDAPFDTAGFGDFDHTVYSDLTNSAYFNADGTVRAGGTATNEPLPAGKSISQFLAGAATDDGMFVQNGWYALDDRNVNNLDGNETNFSNPGSGTSSLLEKTVTGADLGLEESTRIEKFTVWFGFYDVGFDTNGDGFTRTNSNQDAMITQLILGQSIPTAVPEPGVALLAALPLGLLLRRRRV